MRREIADCVYHASLWVDVFEARSLKKQAVVVTVVVFAAAVQVLRL